MLVAASSCQRAGQPRGEEVAVDLVALLPTARVEVEASDFTIGTAAVEPALLSGWSFAERDRSGQRSFRWGLYPASELAFAIVAPRALTLRLEGRPAPDSRAPKRFEVRLNGEPLGKFEVRRGWSQYSIPVPAESQIRGANRLSLVYAPGASREESAPIAKRPNLAVAWSRIAIDGLEHPRDLPTGSDEAMYLPLGSQVEFLIRPGPDARLTVDRVRPIGNRAGTLDVYQQSDGSPQTHLGSVVRGELFELDLSGIEEPIRLALVAAPSAGARAEDTDAVSDGSMGEGFALQAPAVVSRRLAPEILPADKNPGPRPNIIVYLVDTLRSDRLGAYGHIDVSPNLDRFAARASLFANARAQSSWTLASVTSIFTGVWPPAHGVVFPDTALNAEAVTLAEVLEEAGYWTSAIVTNGFVSAEFGLAQGFKEHKTLVRPNLTSEAVLVETIRWLENRKRDKPFFLYLHTLDPHHPYLPKEEFRQRFAADAGAMFESIQAETSRLKWEPTDDTRRQLLALYDAEIAENDDAFGRTLDYLAGEGLFDDSLIVFLSDHGEEFYEHRAWTHGANLFGQTTNTPLVIKLPGQSDGRRIGRVAQHIDLLPTLLDYLELDHDVDGLRGRSLLSDIEGSSSEIDAPPVFSHTFRNKKENLAVIDGEWKYMLRDVPGDSWRILVNWKKDPLELNNLLERYPIRGDYMEALIRSELELGTLVAAREAVLDEGTRNSLRALGYLD